MSFRLPSFTELTATFNSSLQLPGDACNGPNNANSRSFKASIPQRTHSAAPMVAASTPFTGHHLHQAIQQYHGPHQYHTHLPPNGVQRGNRGSAYRFPPSPTRPRSQMYQHQQLNGFGLPEHVSPAQGPIPVGAQSDSRYNQPNYVITGSNSGGYNHQQFEMQPMLPQQQQQKQQQIKHRKADSYDNENSLSALADVASNASVDLQGLVNKLEKVFGFSAKLNSIFEKIFQDFKTSVHSPLGDLGSPTEMLHLIGRFHNQTGDETVQVSADVINDLVQNTSLDILKEAAHITAEIKFFFDQWILYNEQSSHKREPSASGQGDRTNVLDKSPMSSVKPQVKGPTPLQEHVRSKRAREEGDKLNPVTKRHRSFSAERGKGGQSIALVVKPPTPVTLPQSSQPKNNLNQELSIRTHHVCKQCGSDDTPEWRRGPYGVRSLCNACGLFFSKLTRKFGTKEATSIMMQRRDIGEGDNRRLPL